MLVAITS